jgi:hypothetical protein
MAERCIAHCRLSLNCYLPERGCPDSAGRHSWPGGWYHQVENQDYFPKHRNMWQVPGGIFLLIPMQSALYLTVS